MFKLITVEETLLTAPHHFKHPPLSALEYAANERISDRLLPQHGLLLFVWDFLDIGPHQLVLSTGHASTLCKFRVLTFAPALGEAIFTRIHASHANGVVLDMGFFDNIHVDKGLLPKGSVWDKNENVWIWKSGEGEEEATLYMDVGNESVVRVKDINWIEGGRGGMRVEASLHDDVLEGNQGLGDPLWWYEEEEDYAEGGTGEDEGQEAHGEEQVDNQNVEDKGEWNGGLEEEAQEEMADEMNEQYQVGGVGEAFGEA